MTVTPSYYDHYKNVIAVLTRNNAIFLQSIAENNFSVPHGCAEFIKDFVQKQNRETRRYLVLIMNAPLSFEHAVLYSKYANDYVRMPDSKRSRGLYGTFFGIPVVVFPWLEPKVERSIANPIVAITGIHPSWRWW